MTIRGVGGHRINAVHVSNLASNLGVKAKIQSYLLQLKERNEEGVPLEDYYSTYFPSILQYPDQYVEMNKALQIIFDYCSDHRLAMLTAPLVGKESEIPGVGLMGWYEKTYKTLRGFADFCQIETELVTMLLREKAIIIE